MFGNTVLTILRKRDIFFVTTTKPDEIQICCPFCQDGKPRLCWNIKKDSAICFNGGCTYRSKQAAKTILFRLEIDEAINFEVYEPERQEKRVLRIPWPADFVPLTGDSNKVWVRKGYRYLKKRGFHRKEITDLNLGMTFDGKQAYRVLFPLVWRDRLRMLIARDITGSARAKYLNSIGEKFVYNCPDKIVGGNIVLSEGCIKALAIARATDTASGAVLGHTITPLMLRQLELSKARRILLWSDPDWQGIHGTRKAALTLENAGYRVNVLWPVPEMQADDYSTSDLEEMLEHQRHFNRHMELKYAVEQIKRKKVAE